MLRFSLGGLVPGVWSWGIWSWGDLVLGPCCTMKPYAKCGFGPVRTWCCVHKAGHVGLHASAVQYSDLRRSRRTCVRRGCKVAVPQQTPGLWEVTFCCARTSQGGARALLPAWRSGADRASKQGPTRATSDVSFVKPMPASPRGVAHGRGPRLALGLRGAWG